MGIAGLWPLLEPTCQPVSLEALEGKILAVDVSIWIYQAELGYPGEIRYPHVALLVSRLCKLLFYKIRPVFVFDGENVPSFKKAVLEERRLKKHTDDLILTQTKKQTLLDLATGSQTQKEIESVMSKLSSANSKRLRLENDLFDVLPSQKNIEVVELSDDDEDIVVIEEKARDLPLSRSVNYLMDKRERIRASRLRPSQIPSDSKSFSNFQLQRLLTRSHLNIKIQQICENKDLPAVEKSSQSLEACYQHPLSPIEDDEESSSENSDGKGFYSKTAMVEEHSKMKAGHQKAAAVMLRSDDWSSDSGTDDFIDVPTTDPLVDDYLCANEVVQPKERDYPPPSTSGVDHIQEQGPSSSEVKEETLNSSSSSDNSKEWDPAIEEDGKWTSRLDDIKTASIIRDSESYKDLQDFLTACGIPWIAAPGEAEAQCVELERLGLVQGVISDDSDVWAFGVKNVYRHLFSKNKNVQHYTSHVVGKSLGLSQSEFVEIAVLSGGDYSAGLAGVGVVNALELLSEFAVARSDAEHQEKDTLSTLKNVEQWMSSFEAFVDKPEPNVLRRKLRAIIKKNNDFDKIKTIVNSDIVAAYFRPCVDKSREKFRWRSVDIDRVRAFLYAKLGWDDEKFEKQTLTAMQRWNDFITGKASYQRHITSYTHKLEQSPDEQRTHLTKRIEIALSKLARRTGSSASLATLPAERVVQVQSAPSNPESIPRKITRPKRKVTKRKRVSKISQEELRLSEDSGSDEKA